jgi:rhodanese-related sulfurtransferase
MAHTADDVKANRDYFAEKLRVEKQKSDVEHWVKGEPQGGDFLLLDVRARDAFAKAHIQGALNVPVTEIGDLASQLPRDKELVTYCWSHF